jgi:hypothetical protein
MEIVIYYSNIFSRLIKIHRISTLFSDQEATYEGAEVFTASQTCKISQFDA